MSQHWLRLITGVLVALLLCAPAVAEAQTPAEKAEQLNGEGKKLFGEKRYLEASKKFRQAIVLAPDARYYFNLCFTLNFLERYAEALEQCRLVESAGADAELQGKANQLIVELEKRVPPPPPDPGPPDSGDPGDPADPTDPGDGDPGAGDPTTPTDPASPSGNNTGTTAVDAGPTPAGPANPFVEKEARGQYRWSFGGELGVLSNLSIGKTDFGETYADGGPNMRLYANFMLSEARQLGWQVYGGFARLEANDSFNDDLTIFDVGAALFSHRPLSESLYWSPLGGIHISAQKAVDTLSDEAFVTLGLRGEVALSYVFGANDQHALNFTPGLNFYFPSADAVAGIEASEFGLDKPGAALTFNVGYTARFSTLFGMSPLISLE